MNIVTTGDSKFFHCIELLAKSVRKFYGKQAIVYDLGFSEEEKQSLDAHVISLDVDVGFHNFTQSTKVPFIQATHKPFCVKHYFDHFSEPMMLVDADCLFMEKVEETGFDIGVTLKPRRKIDTSDHYAGVLNTGVIFFNVNAAKLIDRWIEECQKPEATDQKALTDILSETIDWKHHDKVYDWYDLKVKTLKIEEYNDYYLKNGKIFHFKGKRHNKEVYKQLIEAMDRDVDIYKVFRKLTKKPKEWPINFLTNRLRRKE